MGLISRVSSRTYRNLASKMSNPTDPEKSEQSNQLGDLLQGIISGQQVPSSKKPTKKKRNNKEKTIEKKFAKEAIPEKEVSIEQKQTPGVVDLVREERIKKQQEAKDKKSKKVKKSKKTEKSNKLDENLSSDDNEAPQVSSTDRLRKKRKWEMVGRALPNNKDRTEKFKEKLLKRTARTGVVELLTQLTSIRNR